MIFPGHSTPPPVLFVQDSQCSGFLNPYLNPEGGPRPAREGALSGGPVGQHMYTTQSRWGLPVKVDGVALKMPLEETIAALIPPTPTLGTMGPATQQPNAYCNSLITSAMSQHDCTPAATNGLAGAPDHHHHHHHHHHQCPISISYSIAMAFMEQRRTILAKVKPRVAKYSSKMLRTLSSAVTVNGGKVPFDEAAAAAATVHLMGGRKLNCFTDEYDLSWKTNVRTTHGVPDYAFVDLWDRLVLVQITRACTPDGLIRIAMQKVVKSCSWLLRTRVNSHASFVICVWIPEKSIVTREVEAELQRIALHARGVDERFELLILVPKANKMSRVFPDKFGSGKELGSDLRHIGTAFNRLQKLSDVWDNMDDDDDEYCLPEIPILGDDDDTIPDIFAIDSTET